LKQKHPIAQRKCKRFCCTTMLDHTHCKSN